MTETKTFTIETAERILPDVRKLISEMRQYKHKITQLINAHKQLARMVEITSDDGFQFVVSHNIKVNRQFHDWCYEFYERLDRFNDTGAILKDLEEGLVDFPFRFEDRDVYLCWKFGEDKVRYWHEIRGGRQPRKQIMDLT
ncbi:DUF2203 domain-containing protein [Candidatus Woesearchaeota archaeon]|nr:DUF2203 domain-containing protein [Candidatus Woesearchaeota archaeon]